MKTVKFFNKLVGKKFNKIFKQLDLLIINFGDPITISLHVGCVVRICNKDKILLTDADELFTAEGLQKTEDQFKDLEEAGYINDPNSLLAKELKELNTLLKNLTVKKVEISPWLDVLIVLEDEIVIQISPDCLMKDYEYYRFIEFIPHYNDDLNKFKSNHYVVFNDQGKLGISTEK